MLPLLLACCAADATPGWAPLHTQAISLDTPTFLAGATLNWLPRQQAIPGRVFTDYDGKTPRAPLDVLVDAGVNTVRVDTAMGDCLVSADFDNSGDVRSREMNNQLDYGCIDTRVATAQLAQGQNMQLVLGIGMGASIPDDWLAYTYTDTLSAIDTELRRQLAPFLSAGVQPAIILLEPEGTAGMLYTVPAGGDGGTRDRGSAMGIPGAQLKQELCGDAATGSYASWPKLTGYYKQEIASARDALTAAGFDANSTRFGLHSDGQAFGG